MGYAVSNNGASWRMVDSASDVLAGETYSDAQPSPPAPTLAQKQAAMWQKILDERARRENGGVLVTVSASGVTPAITKWFYTVVSERLRYMGAARKGAALAPVQWKTMDGSFVTMDSTLVGAVIDAIESADRTNFSNAETHRTNMLAAADPTTYNYSTGWTAIYQ